LAGMGFGKRVTVAVGVECKQGITHVKSERIRLGRLDRQLP
jgi:hypothetical protein